MKKRVWSFLLAFVVMFLVSLTMVTVVTTTPVKAASVTVVDSGGHVHSWRFTKTTYGPWTYSTSEGKYRVVTDYYKCSVCGKTGFVQYQQGGHHCGRMMYKYFPR